MFCTIQLSKSDPTPLYMQLANELSRLIKIGTLPSNTKLPTIRSLSKRLHINRDTVVNAYKVLENQGLILAYIGKGTYVNDTAFSSVLPTLPTTCTSLGFSKDFFPKTILTNLAADIIETEGWGAFSDPLHREKNNVRCAISDFLSSVGIYTHIAQIRLCHQFPQFLLELLKLHPEHCICVEAYHDLTYTSFLRSLGVRLIEIPMTPEGMCLKSLEQVLETHAVSFVWTSTYCQNPTGVTYSEATKKHLLQLASLYDFYILEDGTYSDFVYDYYTLTPLYSMDSEERVIYFHQFSKLYMPHLSYIFIALPTRLSSRILDAIEYTFNERILLFYLQSSYFNELRADLLLQAHQYHLSLVDFFHSLKRYFEVYEMKSGLFFFIKPLKHDVDTITTFLLQHQLLISPSELFTSKTNSVYFRLSYSRLNLSSLNLLKDCLSNLVSL